MSIHPQVPDASNRAAENAATHNFYIPRQQSAGHIPPRHQPTAHAAPQPPQRNGIATAGFVVALVGAVLALIPLIGVVSWVISPIGLVLSIVGVALAGRRGNVGRGLAIAGILLGVVGLIVCSIYAASFARAVNSTPTYTAPTYSAPSYSAPSQQASGGSAATAPANPNQFSAGTYEVGTDIQPGRYKTPGGSFCGWSRNSADDGELGSINANGIVRGPGSVTIKPSDRFVEFSGNCIWTKQ